MDVLLVSLLLPFWTVFAAKTPSQTCVRELENVVLRPVACGLDYFQDLKCQLERTILDSELSKLNQDNTKYLSVSNLCKSFSAQNQVNLDILDQNGVNLCVFKDEVPFIYSEFIYLLSLLPAEFRYETYNTTAYQEHFTGYLPPANSSDMDAVGVVLVNYYFAIYSFNYDSSFIDLLNAVIAQFSTLPLNYGQQVFDLDQVAKISYIIASEPISELNSTILAVSSAMNLTTYYLNSDPVVNFYYFLTLISDRATYGLYSGNLTESTPIQPLGARAAVYSQATSLLLNLQGATGIVKGYSAPLPINVLSDGVCSFSYTKYLASGHVFRIVLSQTKELLMFKKK